MDKVLERASMLVDEIIPIRRDIHQHPELGRKEARTAALVRAKLAEYGVDEIVSPTLTSVVATIRGKKGAGRTVGLRADMDALPVLEETGLPYASVNTGIMHACGHDMHTAMMLGNAKLLCGMRDEFAGTVKLIFQHSEEQFPGGSREILDTGVLDDVDAFFGLHIFPTENNKIGVIQLMKGPVSTSADEVYIDVHGKAGHGALPHKAVDAILAACQINVLLNQIQARNTNPLDTLILSGNLISGGTAINIMPGEARLGVSMRAYTAETREIAHKKIQDICSGVEAISGAKVDIEIKKGYDACYNDEKLVDLLTRTYLEKYNGDGVEMMTEPMGFSEDFSFYHTKTGKPAVIMFLSAGHEGVLSTLHSPTCAVKEEAMPFGMAAMTNAALAFLAE